MRLEDYTFFAEETPSPALVYYPELIQKNIDSMLKIAPAGRLWPHIKTFKMHPVLEMLIASGITKFKCSTILEAKLAAESGATDVLLAYPLVGPNISRFLSLIPAFPATTFYALGDDVEVLSRLSKQAQEKDLIIPTFLDINIGMDRTGALPEEVVSRYETISHLPGLTCAGLHCYGGHLKNADWAAQKKQVIEEQATLRAIEETLQAKGYCVDATIVAGTPTFPLHAAYPHFYLSPGTATIFDYGYASKFPSLPFTPAAAIMARVISRPAPHKFTVDVGCKAIASDPVGAKGLILELPHATPVSQSEEHWVFTVEKEEDLPAIETVLHIIPTHICPTTALYPFVYVVENHKIVGHWTVDARDRTLQPK